MKNIIYKKSILALFAISIATIFLYCYIKHNDFQESTKCVLDDYYGERGKKERDAIISQAYHGNAYLAWKVATCLLTEWGREDPTLSKSERTRKLGNWWMKKSANQGYPLAMIDIATSTNGLNDELIPGFENREEIYTKAFQILVKKEHLNKHEKHYLSICYRFGWGTDKNEKKAHDLEEKK